MLNFKELNFKEYKSIYFISLAIILIVSILLAILLWTDLRYLISFIVGSFVGLLNFTIIVINISKIPLQNRLQTVRILRVNRLIRTVIYALGLLITFPYQEPLLTITVFASYFITKVAIIIDTKFVRKKEV